MADEPSDACSRTDADGVSAVRNKKRKSSRACSHPNGYGSFQNKNDRAQWSPHNTAKFCQIYCDQIDMGHCVRGNMSKWGWKDITERYYAATGLVHDNEQFGNRVRQLKSLWEFIQKLRHKCTGLGRREDGSVIASDQWWLENTEGHPEWRKLKDGWPAYLPEMDRMFLGVAVAGSTSYVPGQSNRIEYIGSDDEEDEDYHLTPLSTGSKRSTSTRSTRNTATSPDKKSRSPIVRAMDKNMKDFIKIMENKNSVLQNIWASRQKALQDKQQALDAKIEQVQAMARECGANETTPDLWFGVTQIIQSERVMVFFMGSAP